MKRSQYRALIQEIVNVHNRIRQDPSSFIPILEAEMKLFEDKILRRPGEIDLRTHEGVSVYEECIEFLRNQPPVPALKLDNILSRAAQDHADDIGPHGIIGHVGSSGFTLDSRISAYINWENKVGENIDFGTITPLGIIISLVVDDGIPSRGHRLNIFHPDFKFIGIGLGPHSKYEHCVVLNYCAEIVRYTGYKGKEEDQNQEVDEVEDPDEPEGYVSCVGKVVSKNVNGKVVKKLVKTYKFEDGTSQVNEIILD